MKSMGLVGAVIWTLICWGAYLLLWLAVGLLNLVGLGGVWLVGWAINFMYGFGVFLVFVIWLIGLAVIFFARSAFRKD